MGHLREAALVVLLGTVWGLNFSLVKFASQSGIPYTLLALLVILGNLALFYGLARVQAGGVALGRGFWRFYAGCGLLGYLVPFFLGLYAAPRIGAGPLAVVVALTPILTLALAGLSGDDRLTRRKAAGVALGFLAVLPLMQREAAALLGLFGLGLLAGLGVALIYALYHVYISRFWPAALSSAQVAFGESLAGAALIAPIHAAAFEAAAVPTSLATYWIVGALILFAGVEVLLYYTLVRRGGPVFVSQAGYLAVIAGVAWGMLLFGEPGTPALFLSVVLMVGALVLVQPRAAP
ncbi:hypothetical protein AY600_10300 [Phormidium willei BDU 130791]|nr:hypothetical protein AY600_10300 [Phormidium willei BDU 130791]